MQKVLVLFAHPAVKRSRVNRRLAKAASEVPGVTFHDLYEAYPDLVIDVSHEQELLAKHDVVVFQHPFYWYSSPAIVKEWMDQVLEHGWAYGPNGTALKDKVMICALTTGGHREAYSREGHNRFTIRELLTPQEQTAFLCGMRFVAPFVVHDALRLDGPHIDPYVDAYRALLEALRDDAVDIGAALLAQRIEEVVVAATPAPFVAKAMGVVKGGAR